MDLTDRYHDHPSEETLEAYALHHLEESEEAMVEEHLLLCTHCQKTLAEQDQYIALMKSAASEDGEVRGKSYALWDRINPFASPAEAAGTTEGSQPRRWQLAQWGAVLAVGCMVAVIAWTIRPQATLPSTSVELSAFRGNQDTAVPTATAGAPIDLTVSAGDLAAALNSPNDRFRLGIVDATGEPVWTGDSLPATDEGLTAHVDTLLEPGQYFVRLFRSAGDSDPNEAIQEFSLLVQ